jgi:hypothetical protein
MPYQLHENVTYCHVGDHLIFLDLNRDLYFQLSDRLERVFLAQLHGDPKPDAEVDDLVRKNILTPSSNAEDPQRTAAIVLPSISAVERKIAASNLDTPTALEVFATVCSTQLQLKTRQLKHLIHALIEYRQRKTTGVGTVPDSSLLEAAATFRRARPYVPIETCCLLDSLSMLRFLSRRRLSASLIFGVTQNPFAAHCWVQAGDWVLNDTVGNVIAHTPIREI